MSAHAMDKSLGGGNREPRTRLYTSTAVYTAAQPTEYYNTIIQPYNMQHTCLSIKYIALGMFLASSIGRALLEMQVGDMMRAKWNK